MKGNTGHVNWFATESSVTAIGH